MSRRKRAAIVFALLAVMAMAAACSRGGAKQTAPRGGGVSPGDGGLAVRTTDEQAAAPAAVATSAKSAQGATVSGSSASDQLLGRKVILNASLDLQVGDVQRAFADVERAAASAGGFVESSKLTGRGDGGSERPQATLRLRVPATALGQVLADLRGLPGAKVMQESSGSREVTGEYTDLQSRLRNLQATEQGYLRLLEQAKSIQDILTVSDRLNQVRGEIEQTQGRIKLLDNLSDLATLDVTLSTAVAVTPAGGGLPGLGAVLARAWSASLLVVRYLGYAAVVVGVVLVWLAAPALVAALVMWRVRRRRAARAA